MEEQGSPVVEGSFPGGDRSAGPSLPPTGLAGTSTVAELLDSAPTSRFHMRAVFMSGMGFFTDAYDLFIIGTALVLIKGEWHLSSPEVSLVGSATLLAAFFGALVFGRIADLLGRKRVYAIVAAVMIVGALSSALATGIVWLVASRFVLGFGIGGDYPVSAVLMSEYSNRDDRGRLVGLVFSMQALGLVVGPVVGLTLVASGMSHDIAWRIMLALGAVPAAAVVYMRTKMPESPRFEAKVKGDEARAAAQLALFSDGVIEEGSAAGPPRRPADVVPYGLRQFLSDRRMLLTLLGTAGTWFLLDYAYYGNTISTPLIMKDVAPHASLAAGLAWTLAIFVVFAVPGYVLAFSFMDRIGHRRLQVLGFAAMAVAFGVLALVPGITTTVVPFLIVYGISYLFTEFGPNTTTFVLPSEVYPVSVRTTGHGISAGVGKLGAFAGVFLFPVIQAAFGLRGSLAVAALAAVLGLCLTFVLPEPAGRSLEEVSGEDAYYAKAASGPGEADDVNVPRDGEGPLLEPGSGESLPVPAALTRVSRSA